MSQIILGKTCDEKSARLRDYRPALQTAVTVICEQMRSIHGPSRTTVYAALADIKRLFRELEKDIREGRV